MTSAARPAPGPPREYRFPAFQRLSLANGMGLVIAPVTKLPLVTVALVSEAGAVADPAGREGVAGLTAKLLLEGTATLTAAELIERFERLGASVDSAASWDVAVLRMTVMSEQLRPALALLSEVVLGAIFPEREVGRLRAERLAELLQQRAEPRGLADEMFEHFAYAPDSRYALPAGGSEDSVRGLQRGDVATFHAERYRPGGTTMIVVGDVAPDEAERLARDAFGGWTGGAPPLARTSDAPARDSRAVHLVAKPDASQSELRIGHPGVPRNHPEYFPILVMNALLGGLFNSRINMNLRERHAYTYGAFSAFDFRRQAGPFAVSTAVKSEVTAAAIGEIFGEIDRLRAEAPADDELSLALSYLGGVFPIRFETTTAIASALASLVTYGLPDDWFDLYRERVRGVTADAVREAARRFLRPESMQVVIVGDARVVREPVAALGIGPVTGYMSTGAALD